MKEKEIAKEQTKCVLDDLIPVSKFNEYFKYPTTGTLRQIIFRKEKYKFENVIKKLGGRIYISISAFNKWVEEQNQIA